ncbi:uncharacterized protein LOC131245228 [Magnolia sinica]|uniref:uncharacterized protein LOC131245228 n=1 Tax=Magnolia sinica TaxID=86752 RepID=UPI00265B3BA3|nr:uncharacterized protein LOC131245228 [Magnolia sinica]
MPRFTVFLFLLLLLLLFHSSSGEIGTVDNGKKFVHPSRKMNLRKLMEASLHDYDYGGPNPRHYPKKGKPPGPGSRNR